MEAPSKLTYYVKGAHPDANYCVVGDYCKFKSVSYVTPQGDYDIIRCRPDGTPWYSVITPYIRKRSDDIPPVHICVQIEPKCENAKRIQMFLVEARNHAIIIWDGSGPKMINDHYVVLESPQDIDRSVETKDYKTYYLILSPDRTSIADVLVSDFLAKDKYKPFGERRKRQTLSRPHYLEYMCSKDHCITAVANVELSEHNALKDSYKARPTGDLRPIYTPEDCVKNAMFRKYNSGEFTDATEEYTFTVPMLLLDGDVTVTFKRNPGDS